MEPNPSLRSRALAIAIAAALTITANVIRADQGGSVPADRTLVTHLLNRVTFGPAPGDVDRVQRMGIDAYLEEQLHPERIDDSVLESRLAVFETLTLSSAELSEKYLTPAAELRREQQRAAPPAAAMPAEAMTGGDAPRAARQAMTPEARRVVAAQRAVMDELSQARMLRAVLSERQLQEVLTDFWFNHFNVFVGKGQVRAYLTEYEREAIRPHVLGTFRELLGAVAESPAMLIYLDNWQSAAPATASSNSALEQRLSDPRLSPEARQRLMQRARQANQARRPTRGINENYARELMELHTLGVDGGYTQKDVVELARILTGWTIDRPRDGGSFIFNAGMHDRGTKTFLGHTFGNAGQVEGTRALDLLAAHPSTAKHIAFKLAQRFVSDTPPEALVERASRVFTESKGDIRQVVRAIVTSQEFLAAGSQKAKVKTPLEFVVSAARATGAVVSNAQPLVAALRSLGMPLYGSQPPTGYAMTAETWVNTGALLSRMNFAVSLMDGGRIQPQEGRVQAREERIQPQGARPGPIRIDATGLAPDTGEESRERVIAALLGGQASEATRQTLARADTPKQLIALALGSPEFQRR